MWVAVLQAVLSLAVALVTYLKDKKSLDAAQADILSKHLTGALDELKRANAASDSVSTSIDADPAELRKPDPFQRPD